MLTGSSKSLSSGTFLLFSPSVSVPSFLSKEDVSWSKRVKIFNWCKINSEIFHMQEKGQSCLPRNMLSPHGKGLLQLLWYAKRGLEETIQQNESLNISVISNCENIEKYFPVRGFEERRPNLQLLHRNLIKLFRKLISSNIHEMN